MTIKTDTPAQRDLDVLALLRDRESSDQLKAAWAGLNGHRLRIAVGDARTDAGDRTPDVLLVDVAPQSQQDLDRLQRLRTRGFPGCPVIAAGADLALGDVRRLMRAGVVDVVPRPFQTEEVLAAVQAAAGALTAASVDGSGGRVVSFLGGGGGAGTTTVAVQTACALAGDTGKKGSGVGQRIALLDLDVQFGTVALNLDMATEADVTGLVTAPDRLDATLLGSVVTRHASGIDVLPGPATVMPLEAVPAEFAARLLAVARQAYTTTFVELPAAWTEWTSVVLEASDAVVIVTQLTVPGIRQTRRQLDALRREGLDDGRVHIVANRFAPTWRNRDRRKQAEKGLGRQIDAFVPNDFKTVSRAADMGVALREVTRRSAVEKALLKLARSLCGAPAGVRVQPTVNS